MSAIMISIKVFEFRDLLKAKLGTVPAGGRSYEGRIIESFTFERFDIVDYTMADGKRGPKFQDLMYMDD
jgi:hypothetical protein